METIIHELKDEEMPKHSMCSEGWRLKQYRGKNGALQAMAVPASTPYSREEKEIEKEMKQFIYSDEIHHPDHYTWKGVECKDVIETMVTGLSGIEAYYMGNIIKYLYRYPRKGTIETDLAKAEEYIHFLRECYQNRKEDKNE